jgi:cobalt/nickel transport system permease protein
MHIPDGFLTPQVFLSAWILALGILNYALRKTKQMLKDKMVPLMGVMAAFIFAAQMVNFPVLGGTSGHLLGGVLASLTLGPYAGCIVLSLVLAVQCFIFQDGGLTALGANIFNMAVVGTMLNYYLYLFFRKTFACKHMLLAVFASSWCSVVLAATFCSLELTISGISPLRIVLPAMLLVHIFIGIGEGLITASIIAFLLKVRPDLIYEQAK